MSYLMQPNTVLLFSAATLSAVMALSALKMRPNLGTRSFAVLMSAVALWALVSVFEVISRDVETKLFSYGLKYLFIVIVPVAWLSFGLFYANRLRRWRMSYFLLLLIVPVVTLVMVATNETHHLMFTTIDWYEYDKGLLLRRGFGPWFWVHTVYSYILLSLGYVFLFKSLIDSPKPYRNQLISLLIGGFTPWVFNVLFIFGQRPFPYLDLTPFAFSISGLAFIWGVMRYHLLDLIPIARDIVIRNLQDGVMVLDDNDRILDINPTAAHFMMKKNEDLIGRRIHRIISWWSSNNISTADKNDDASRIIKIDHNDGPQWIRITQSPLMQNNRSAGYLVMLSNVTAIKAAEAALRMSEDCFKSLTENAPILIFSLDESRILTYVNPAWTQILGYPRDEVVGRPFNNYIANNYHSVHEDIFQRIINGKKSCADINLELVHRDGSTRIFDLSAAVNSDIEGRVNGIIGLAKNITEETKLQEQLLMSQKMEAIGTLAGGIAHDFNNLLMGIQANISLLRLEAAQDNPLQKKLNRMEDQIQNGASLTRQLLGYARKGKYHVHPIDVRKLIEDTLSVVRRTNKQIQIAQQFCDGPLMMVADRGQIELVMLNLFVNAVDAMPDGGDLIVSANLIDAKEMGDPWSDLKPGSYIKIEVTDTGMGMDEQTKDRIFEPFFTTKEIGRGTGLGLASVYGVVVNHDGHIWAESSTGKGTTFKILFPASPIIDEKESVLPTSADTEILTSPGGTILIVDDEPIILKSCGEMIHSLGYKVLYADCGKQAIDIYENRYMDIDLVILDMIMPVQDGCGVYQALKAINPSVQVIIASGYGLNERAQKILAEGPHGQLKKPYTLNELASIINEVKAIASKASYTDSRLH